MLFSAALKRAMSGTTSDDSESQRAKEGEVEARDDEEEIDQMTAEDDVVNTSSLEPVEDAFGEAADEGASQVRFHLRNIQNFDNK